MWECDGRCGLTFLFVRNQETPQHLLLVTSTIVMINRWSPLSFQLPLQINSWCTCLIFICSFECILQISHQYVLPLISFSYAGGVEFPFKGLRLYFSFCPQAFWFMTGRCWLDWVQTKQRLRPVSRPIGCVTNQCLSYVTSVIDLVCCGL